MDSIYKEKNIIDLTDDPPQGSNSPLESQTIIIEDTVDTPLLLPESDVEIIEEVRHRNGMPVECHFYYTCVEDREEKISKDPLDPLSPNSEWIDYNTLNPEQVENKPIVQDPLSRASAFSSSEVDPLEIVDIIKTEIEEIDIKPDLKLLQTTDVNQSPQNCNIDVSEDLVNTSPATNKESNSETIKRNTLHYSNRDHSTPPKKRKKDNETVKEKNSSIKEIDSQDALRKSLEKEALFQKEINPELTKNYLSNDTSKTIGLRYLLTCNENTSFSEIYDLQSSNWQISERNAYRSLFQPADLCEENRKAENHNNRDSLLENESLTPSNNNCLNEGDYFPNSEYKYSYYLDDTVETCSDQRNLEEIDIKETDLKVLKVEAQEENDKVDHNFGLMQKKILHENSEISSVKTHSIPRSSKKNKNCCYYCESLVYDFSRHIMRHHKNEVLVEKIILCGKGPQRNKLLSELRKKGNYLYSSYGEIKPVKKILTETNPSKYKPCPYCCGFYAKTRFLQHKKKCDKYISRKTASNVEGSELLLPSEDSKHLNLIEKVFSRMHENVPNEIAKNDELICKFGLKYLETHNQDYQIHLCSRKMRELALVLLEIKKLDRTITNLIQALHPENFYMLVQAAKNAAGLNKETGKFRDINFGLYVGKSLTVCCEIAISDAIKKNPTHQEEHFAKIESELKEAMILIQSKWRSLILLEIGNKIFKAGKAKKSLNSKKREIHKWTPHQKQIVKAFFHHNIKTKSAPKKNQVLKLCQIYHDIGLPENWKKIKVFVQNVYLHKLRI